MRAQIVPKFDLLESAVKHKVWWATRSWKLCMCLILLAMSVYVIYNIHDDFAVAVLKNSSRSCTMGNFQSLLVLPAQD